MVFKKDARTRSLRDATLLFHCLHAAAAVAEDNDDKEDDQSNDDDHDDNDGINISMDKPISIILAVNSLLLYSLKMGTSPHTHPLHPNGACTRQSQLPRTRTV